MNTPLSWYSKELLRQKEVLVQRELHAIIKEYGSCSPVFCNKQKELEQIQIELYINRKTLNTYHS